MSKLNEIRENVVSDLSSCLTVDQVGKTKIKYLGRKGIINQLFQEISASPLEEKKEKGKTINRLKSFIEEKIEDAKRRLSYSSNEWIDIALPGKLYPKGSLHVVTLAIEKISRIFEKIGFIRMTYPEVEWEYFSFESLNMLKGHPARDDFETFFIDAPQSKTYGRMILSPHTSSGQVREMLRVGKPPIRMISIAKCYRPNWDSTHNPMFYQFESLCVDKNINITQLKETIDYFVKQFFGEKTEVRLRPHHFQFTEPSFEIDITCTICQGKGEVKGIKCRVCKSGWLELAGAGMVHPNVLKAGRIDPKTYTGWAFAFGIERLLMMIEGISLNDIRILYSGDIRFLQQF